MANSKQNILSRVKHRATSNIARFDIDAVFYDCHMLDRRADIGE
jgi:hypothetical protein